MSLDAAPDAAPTAAEPVVPAAALPRLSARQGSDAWEIEKRQMALLLREAAPDAAWAVRLEAALARQRLLTQRDPDLAIYLLLQAAACELDRYSSHHAMLCALVCELCARRFEWPEAEVDALVRAALTMNLSMTATQDTLARQATPLSAAQREDVDSHAERSAALLAAAGVSDTLWIETVRLHHGVAASAAEAAPAERLAELLKRVDVYTARLSRRATREPTPPAIAARHACLDAEGRPDAIGATLLRMLGLYPPGCFVQLASGEVGIVIRRGAKAHTPVVAALRRDDGGLHLQPPRRDSAEPPHAVVCGVHAQSVRLNVNHLRALAAA